MTLPVPGSPLCTGSKEGQGLSFPRLIRLPNLSRKRYVNPAVPQYVSIS